jgi:universal stress protein E
MAATPRILLIASPLMSRTPAFDRALGLARAMDAALHIIAFDYLEGLVLSDLASGSVQQRLRDAYPQRHRKWLDQQVSGNRNLGMKVTCETRWIKDVVAQTLDYVGEASPDWIIKDVHQEPLLARVMFTSVDMHLLHRYPNRLHLVTSARCSVPRQIMVAIDLYQQDDQYPGLNERLIREGVRLGLVCSAQVHLVYAYALSMVAPTQWAHGGGMLTSAAALAQEVELAAARRLHALAEHEGLANENCHLLTGSPRRALLRFAEAHYIDMMIMGRSDRFGAEKWLGSTTEHVMSKMSSSLLVVR